MGRDPDRLMPDSAQAPSGATGTIATTQRHAPSTNVYRRLNNTSKGNANRSHVAASTENTAWSRFVRIATFKPCIEWARNASDAGQESSHQYDPTLPPLYGWSLGMFSPANRFRKFCHSVMQNKMTEYFIMTAIFVNVVALSLESQEVTRNKDFGDTLYYIDLGITCIFTIEMIMRIVADGLVKGPTAYLISGWNRLDCVIVIASWIFFIVSGVSDVNVRFGSVRALRALRPLRALKFFEGIRAILVSLGQSTRLLVDVIAVILFFFVIYGVLGVQLFGGSLRRTCVDEVSGLQLQPLRYCNVDKTFGYKCPLGALCVTGDNPNFGYVGFDNIGLAFLTIFRCMTLEGWVDVLYAMQDAENELSWIYFVTLVIVLAFLVVNLFVAVISATFSRIRGEQHRSAFSKEKVNNHRKLVITQTDDEGWRLDVVDDDSSSAEVDRLLGPGLVALTAGSHADDDGNYEGSNSIWTRIVEFSEFLINHPYFEGFIMLLILINSGFIAAEYHGQSEEHKRVLFRAEIVFTVFWAVEMVLRMIGNRGIIGYFRKPHNRLDFLIVVTSILNVWLQQVSNISFLRAFRLLRVFRFMIQFPRLAGLLRTVFGSLTAIGNLLAFIAFALLVFAIFGTQIFSGTFNNTVPTRFHFDSFLHAILSLFVVLTGENWIDVMYNAMQSDTGPWMAVPYFLIFYVFSVYILLNLFIAVILENFEIPEHEKLEKQRLFHTMQMHQDQTQALKFLNENQGAPLDANPSGRAHGGTVIDGYGEYRRAVFAVHSGPGGKYQAGADMTNNRMSTYASHHDVHDSHRRPHGMASPRADGSTRQYQSSVNTNRYISVPALPNGFVPRIEHHIVFNFLNDGSPHKSRDPGLPTGHPEIEMADLASDNFKEEKLRSLHDHQHQHPSSHGNGEDYEQLFSERHIPQLQEDTTLPALTPAQAATQQHEEQQRRMSKIRQSFLRSGRKSSTASSFGPFSQASQSPLTGPTSVGSWAEGTGTQGHVPPGLPHPAAPTNANINHRRPSVFGTPMSMEKVIARVRASTDGVTSQRTRSSTLTPLSRAHMRGSNASAATTGSGAPSAGVGTDSMMYRRKHSQVSGHGALSSSQGNDGPAGVLPDQLLGLRASPSNTSISSASDQLLSPRLSIDLTNSSGDESYHHKHRDHDHDSTTSDDDIRDGSSTRRSDVTSATSKPLLNKRTTTHLPVRTVNLTGDDGMKGRILFCIPAQSRFRLALRDMVQHQAFDRMIVFFILCSCVFLAIDYPDKSDTLARILTIADWVFLVLFTLEFIVKVLAHGFYFTGQKAYLRQPWNRFDLVLLIIMYVGIAADGFQVGRALRAVRALRPLLLLNRLQSMRIIVLSLGRSMPAFLNVTLLMILFFFIFGILGVTMFSGKFYRCNDPAIEHREECLGEFFSEDDGGTFLPRVWSNPRYSFDHAGVAMLTLFEVASLEGWLDVLGSAMDITDVDRQPKYNNSPWNALYFVAFIFIGSFFVVKLFVGVILDNFNQQRGTGILTEEQRQWVDLRRVLRQTHPLVAVERPTQPIRAFMFDLVFSPGFGRFIIGAILVNVVFMLADHYNQPDSFADFQFGIDLIFLAIFLVEIIIKMIPLGIRGYFKDPWNTFDFFVVMGSLIAFMVPQSLRLTLSRASRVLRVVRLVRNWSGLRTLFSTLLISLPSMAGIAMLLFILFFIYATTGVVLFGRTRLGQHLTTHANFRNFPQAMLVLFRISTGENWNGIMHDCWIQEPECIPSECGSIFSPVFFISFYVVGVYIFWNLVIAVILENFSYSFTKEMGRISSSDIETFKEKWSRYDPLAKGYIPFWKLREFIESLGQEKSTPLKMDTYGADRMSYRLLRWELEENERVARKVPAGYVSFQAVLNNLALRLLGMSVLTYSERVSREERLHEIHSHVLASKITAVVRGWRVRNRLPPALVRGKGRRRPHDLLLASLPRIDGRAGLNSSGRFTSDPINSVGVFTRGDSKMISRTRTQTYQGHVNTGSWLDGHGASDAAHGVDSGLALDDDMDFLNPASLQDRMPRGSNDSDLPPTTVHRQRLPRLDLSDLHDLVDESTTANTTANSTLGATGRDTSLVEMLDQGLQDDNLRDEHLDWLFEDDLEQQRLKAKKKRQQEMMRQKNRKRGLLSGNARVRRAQTMAGPSSEATPFLTPAGETAKAIGNAWRSRSPVSEQDPPRKVSYEHASDREHDENMKGWELIRQAFARDGEAQDNSLPSFWERNIDSVEIELGTGAVEH